ncbi:MAG: WYL domain-containing protein, partial [Planctomycetia bacterium]|nr:WYL domain-containing protein [Planctomycetia bacterium]
MDTGDRTLARPRGTGRLQRVLKMLTRLQTGQFCNADELASVCGVSRRTIYRDIGALEAAGIGLYYDRKTGGYKVSSACFLPPVDLNITEALSIILLASELGGKGKWPLVGPACDAAAKIASNLPVGIRALVAQMLQRVKIRGQRFARHEHLEDIYEQLQKAIQHRHRVEVTYISFHEAKQIRTRLGPYWLLFHSRAWYVIGHSSLHKAVRTFKLGRIKS